LKGWRGLHAENSPSSARRHPTSIPRPDLWVTAKSGYSFVDTADAKEIVVPRTTHGGTPRLRAQPRRNARHARPLGHGIQPGAKLGKVSNQDVAPTIARLLGVENAVGGWQR